jgi:beta-N-acetylhexosaminidase
VPVEVATVSDAAHQRLSGEAYARSTTLVRDDAHLLPLRLSPETPVLVVAQPPANVTKAVDTVYRHADLVDAINARHANTRGVCLAPDADDEALAELLRTADASDLLIVATINAHLDPPQMRLMRRLLASGRPIIGIAACNPYDLAAFPAVQTALATYEYTQPALSAAADVLFGANVPTGRLPVSLFSPAVDASGD